MIRQLGAALGTAILVAVVSDPDPARAPDAFDRGYLFVATGGLLTAATTLLLERTRRPVNEPKVGVFPQADESRRSAA